MLSRSRDSLAFSWLNHRAMGMTLVEVLVAMIVVSIAMVGAVSYQNYALKSAFTTSNRSSAQILCHDLFERVRSNKAGAEFYASTTHNPTRTLNATVANDGSGKFINFAAHPSSVPPSEVLANNDLRDWTQSLAEQNLTVQSVEVSTRNPGNLALQILSIRIVLWWNRQLSATEFERVNSAATPPDGYQEGSTFRREEFECETLILRESA